MITKNQIKLVVSLRQKKYREESRLFFAEGVKVVKEMISAGAALKYVFCTEEIANTELVGIPDLPLYIGSSDDLKKMTALSTSPGILAVAEIPDAAATAVRNEDQLILALDDIRDPGNLGTIIRLADWFGIKHVLCSHGTADLYNPKVIQSTMGSFLRVNVKYLDLPDNLIKLHANGFHIYGMYLDGTDIYKADFPAKSVFVIGNESNGISEEVSSSISEKVTIPSFGKGAESLNAAIAATVVTTLFKDKFR